MDCLSTPRLLLRPLVQDDLKAIYAIFSNPEVTRYYEIDTLAAESQARVVLDYFMQTGRFGIVFDGQLVGTCGLFALNQQYFSASCGYDLAREYWGRAIMREALGALFEHAFATLGLNRINALCAPGNAASQKTLAHFGFQREGLMREFGYWKGEFHDMYLYALIRRDWSGGSAC